jgi:hypothetical protein
VHNLAKRRGPYLTWNCHSFTKRKQPYCTFGAYNPINFTIFNLNETGWEVGKKFDILIYENETDPGILLHFQLIMITQDDMSVPHTRAFTPFMRRYKVSFLSYLKPKTCSSH